MNVKKAVCLIGAGSSGIAAGKTLKENGITFDCFEKGSQIEGNRLFLSSVLRLARGKQEDFGVPKPKRPLLGEYPTLSQDLLNLAGRGLIKFKPNTKEFKGKTIVLKTERSKILT